MEEKKLTEQESLSIIQSMIRVAREDYRENGMNWLIWGWMLFVSSVASAILGYLHMRQYIGWVWTGMLVAGLIVYFFLYTRPAHKQRVKTYVQEIMEKCGTGFFISLFIIIIAGIKMGDSPGYQDSPFGLGYYYILYAFWMFIRGNAIHFRPLIYGAFVNWTAALVIFWIRDLELAMIVSAIAILCGYLIPGYMLRAEYKKKMLH